MAKKRSCAKVDVEWLKAQIAEGDSVQDVARKTGLGRETVRRLCERHGLRVRPARFSMQRIREIAELAEEGYGASMICNLLNVSIGPRFWAAAEYAGVAEKLRARRPGTRRLVGGDRECITCRATFRSEGPHHRMCNRCRQSADGGMPAGWEYI